MVKDRFQRSRERNPEMEGGGLVESRMVLYQSEDILGIKQMASTRFLLQASSATRKSLTVFGGLEGVETSHVGSKLHPHPPLSPLIVFCLQDRGEELFGALDHGRLDLALLQANPQVQKDDLAGGFSIDQGGGYLMGEGRAPDTMEKGEMAGIQQGVGWISINKIETAVKDIRTLIAPSEVDEVGISPVSGDRVSIGTLEKGCYASLGRIPSWVSNSLPCSLSFPEGSADGRGQTDIESGEFAMRRLFCFSHSGSQKPHLDAQMARGKSDWLCDRIRDKGIVAGVHFGEGDSKLGGLLDFSRERDEHNKLEKSKLKAKAKGKR